MITSLTYRAGRPRLARRGRVQGLRLPLVALLALLLSNVVGPLSSADASSANARNIGVATLTGSFTITSPFILESRTDPYVLLRDLGVFFYESGEEASATHQILGGVEGDVADEAEYTISLPILPAGTFIDVDNGEGDGDDDGILLFEVVVVSDAIGDPFFGPDEQGWGTPVSSTIIDGETYEWTGYFVVWAPDDEQFFPSGPGEDGWLFSNDDPVEPLEAGWTVVNIDRNSAEFLRDQTVEVPLTEQAEAHVDLSDLSYIEAFDTLVEDLRVRYAFKDIKEIDFDAIVDEIRPLIVEAEEEEDPVAYRIAMLKFAASFGDGHVAISTRDGMLDDYFTDRYGGGLGITLGWTDDEELIVVTVTPDSPADEAGIEPGAEILRWDGDTPEEALENVELIRGESSEHGERFSQLLLLPRMPIGEEVELRFRNPDEDDSETVELEAFEDPAGQEAALRPIGANPAELPVTASVLPSGVGYIRVNTFMDDVALMFDSWEWALNRMEELEVPALIIDVRGNGGGWGSMATYFAGTFIEEEFNLADDYLADADGDFRRVSSNIVEPSPIQWDRPVAVLIDENCASACEIFSASMAHNPEVLIVGHTPTAGVEAGVLPWTLPDGLYFQASIYLMLDEEGDVFLEGTGVPPTIDVEVTTESLLSPDDEVLLAAEDALIDQVED